MYTIGQNKSHPKRIDRAIPLWAYAMVAWLALGIPSSLWAFDELGEEKESVSVQEIDPQARELYKLSYEVAQRRDYPAAITYLEQALKISPRYQDALFNLGSLYMAQKKYAEAYFFYQRLLYLKPDDHEARLQKINALIGMQNASEALHEIAKVPPQTSGFDQVQNRVTRLAGQIIQPSGEDELSEGLSSTQKARDSVKTPPENNSNQSETTPTPEALIAKVQESKRLPSNAKTQESPQKNQLIPSPAIAQKGFYGYVTPNSKPTLPRVLISNFSAPTGIASDNQSIYIANFLENKIEKITPDGKRREVFADGGLLAGPSGMVFNPQDGRLYVSNYKTGTIVAIEPTGEIRLIARDLLKPYALLLHENGKLYVSEQGKKAISVVEIKK